MKAGTYQVQVVDFDLGYSETGTEQAAIRFSVLEGQECEGETIVGYLFFSERAVERAIQTLRKMGWTGMDIGCISTDDLQNTMEIVVDTEQYNGKDVLKVKWIQLPGERGALQKNSMNDNQRLDFSERMRGIAMSMPAPGAAQGAANNAQAPRKATPPRGQPSQVSNGRAPSVKREDWVSPPKRAAAAPQRGPATLNDDDCPF